VIREARKMDNPYYEWSPMSERPRLAWPGDAAVALCVIVSLERLELLPPEGSFVPPSAVGYGPYPRAFQLTGVARREYGNRVGVFRVMEILDRYGIKATVAIDGQLALANPFLVHECLHRGWEVIGHGVAYSRMITSEMDEREEREHIRQSLDAVEQATGRRPLGWVGADYGESERTVALLAELGVRYVCDWANDEQPYRMNVPEGSMVSLPVSGDLDDVYTHKVRQVPIHRWSRMVQEAFRRLEQDGRTSGRLLNLNLHPYLIGQPFRSKYLDEALGAIAASDSVWSATGSEIVDWYEGGR
jgi:peptidoglycan/xylan/chitin deacetylase (PgdA/CDA1 family)